MAWRPGPQPPRRGWVWPTAIVGALLVAILGGFGVYRLLDAQTSRRPVASVTATPPVPTGSTVTDAEPFDEAAPSNTPIVAESGQWLAVLESLPKDQHAAEGAYAKAEALGHGAVFVDSSQTPGLKPGYWVVAALTDSRDAATAACADFGREVGGTCYPREVG